MNKTHKTVRPSTYNEFDTEDGTVRIRKTAYRVWTITKDEIKCHTDWLTFQACWSYKKKHFNEDTDIVKISSCDTEKNLKVYQDLLF